MNPREEARLEAFVPPSLRGQAFGLEAWQWLGLVVALLLALLLAQVVMRILGRGLRKLARRTSVQWDDEMVAALEEPGQGFLALAAFRAFEATLGLGPEVRDLVARGLSTIFIGLVGWTAVRVVTVISRLLERRAIQQAECADDVELCVRGITTQVRVLRRVANVGIVIVAAALMLTQFEAVRTVGVSLLASAGLAGVVLGFAAQRTFGSLIAGIQLSATQPIRIGDVVIVEKEWGTIEEITLTFVVVRVWDERRLIVPMTRFLDQPFENWTKVTSQLHGTVFLQVDWALPVDEMRAELDRIVEGHPLWDGRSKSIQVTDAKERTLEVRALVSAANAGALWDLRVHVREKLVAWLREHEGGRYLPRVRLEGDREPSAVSATHVSARTS